MPSQRPSILLATRLVALTVLGSMTSSPSSAAKAGEVEARPAIVTVQIVSQPEHEADEAGFVFRITRTSDQAAESVPLRLTTRGTMTAGQDFVSPPPFVVLPAGERWIEVRVVLIDDPVAERYETLELVATPIELRSTQ